MKILYITLLIFIPNLLLGQTWNLQEGKAKGKYKYEYWLVISEKPKELAEADTTIFSSPIFDPMVYTIYSKQELTDLEKEKIESCIRKNLSGPVNQCGKRKKYKVYMQV